MNTLCDICPFGRSEKAFAKWAAEKLDCNKIENCAEVLLKEYGQTTPHPCFKAHEFTLNPVKKDQIPCGGHARWLQEHSEESNAAVV